MRACTLRPVSIWCLGACSCPHPFVPAETVDALEQNLQSKMALLRQVATALPEEASFVSVKLTALVDPVLLESVTSALLSATDESSSGVPVHVA